MHVITNYYQKYIKRILVDFAKLELYTYNIPVTTKSIAQVTLVNNRRVVVL